MALRVICIFQFPYLPPLHHSYHSRTRCPPLPSSPLPPPTGESQKLTVFSIVTQLDKGGGMHVSYEASVIPTQMYGGDASLIVIVVFQALYFIGILANVIQEAREMAQAQRTSGTILAYFDSPWNWLDIASLILEVVGVSLW